MLQFKFEPFNKLFNKRTFRTVLRQSCAAFVEKWKFAVCRLIKKICEFAISDLRTGTQNQCADLRLRNEPKNVRICHLRA
jgi:hypothetical protein